MENDWKNTPSNLPGQVKPCECDQRQPGSPFTDGTTVCVNCSGIIFRGIPGFNTAATPFRVGSVISPLEAERRAFWSEAFHSVDWDRTKDAREVTAKCAEYADAALAEFDKRFS